MAAGFDDLIERLLHEVALTGTQGLSASQFTTIVQKYYDEKNSHVIDPPEDDDDDPLFSAKPPAQKTTVDEALFGTILAWLCKNPEVGLVQVTTSDSEQPNQDTPSSSSFRQKLDGKHIFVSEERVWLTLTGHGIDHKRIPPREFALLSVVAAAGPRGILQPYAGKLTDQDKRSVPKRTDMLAEKGYIVKEHVIGTGAKTTVLRLKRWTTGEQPLRSVDHPMTDPEKGGHPVIFYDAWYDTTIRALKENRGMVAMKDLRLQLGTNGRRWETKVLMRCIKRVTESGLIRRMTAKYHDKYGNPIRIAGTKRECVAHAIQLLREPTDQDRVTWRSSEPGQKLALEDSDGDEDDGGVEDAAGEVDEEAEQGTFVADVNGAAGIYKLTAPADQGVVSDDEGQVTFEDEADALTSTASRIEPQWTPDLPLVNVFHRIIDDAGQKGISAMDLGSVISGPSWRRPIDQCMLLLTDVGQYSQPPHLKHLAIVRDTAVRAKFSHYRYRTRPHFDKAVAAGEATQQKLVAGNGKQKVDGISAALDEWGFPNVLPKDLVNRDGRATLTGGRKGIQFEIADGSGQEDEAGQPNDADLSRTTGAVDGTLNHAVATFRPQVQAASAVPLNITPKPTRARKPTLKTRDLVPPSTSRSGNKRGPYRQRRPEERSAVPLVKKREIPQHEYDDFDGIAQAMAERKVLAEMKASRKRSATEADASNTTEGSRKAARLSNASPQTDQQEITFADLPSGRVAEIKEEILAREKPGVYINPPGARTIKIENFIQVGRPRNALIAVVKTDQLKQFDWFHYDEGPRFAPKASKGRTSRVCHRSKLRKKTPEHVENSGSEEEEEEAEEDEEDRDEEEPADQARLMAEDSTQATPQVLSVKVSGETYAALQTDQIQLLQASQLPSEGANTPAKGPPAKQLQTRPPASGGRSRSRSKVAEQAGSSDSPVFSAKPSSSMHSRTGSAPRMATNAASSDPSQEPCISCVIDSHEQRQEAAARGLAAAIAYEHTMPRTPQPSANGFGLDGQQDELFGRRSEQAVLSKQAATTPLTPEDLVSDDEFETVASMVGSRPQDLMPLSDASSDVDSDATEEWVPPVLQKSVGHGHLNASQSVTTKQSVAIESAEALPTTTRATKSGSGPVSSNFTTSADSTETQAIATSSQTPTTRSKPIQPADDITSAATPIATLDDAAVQVATPVAPVSFPDDAMTPAQELKMLMAKTGRKSKAVHSRMAELNRQIDPEKSAKSPTSKTPTPPPRSVSPPVPTYSTSSVRTFDRRYVDAHPDEEFHHRGGGRWARGPRDFKIRNEHRPNTLLRQAAAARPSVMIESEKPPDTAAEDYVAPKTPRIVPSTSVEATTNVADAIQEPLHSIPDPVDQTFSSQYVDEHPHEDFYHRGQGRWIRGLPPPGSSGRTGVRGPGSQQWKMSVLGYGVSLKPKKPNTPTTATTTMATSRSQAEKTTSRESMLVKLPVPQGRLTNGPSPAIEEEQSTPLQNGDPSKSMTPSSLTIVKPYSASSLQIVRPYSSYASPIASSAPLDINNSEATSSLQMVLRTPSRSSAASVIATPSSTPTHSKATLKSKYQDYPEGTSDEEIFNGDPDLLIMDNLFRLAQRYTMMEIVEKINAGRPEPVVNQPNLSNRLARAISDIAIRHNKPREEVVVDLRLAQQTNGVPMNGRRRKTETLLKKVLKQPRRQSDVTATPNGTYTEAEMGSSAQKIQHPRSSNAAAAASESQQEAARPSLKRKRGISKSSEAVPADADAPPLYFSEDEGMTNDAMDGATHETTAALSGHDINMIDAPPQVEASAGYDTNTPSDVSLNQDEALGDPSVSLIEDSSKPLTRPPTKRGSVSIKAQRRKIILDAVRACNGVFPGDGQPWYVSATIWQRVHGQEPDRRTVDAFVQDLVGEKKLKRMVLKFKKNNEDIVRHIITEPDVDPSSPFVKDLQKKIIDAHPFVYLPPEADISEERRQKAARRYWKDDGGGHTRSGGTGSGRQPMVSFAVQQTKEAAEAEDREAKEHGFENAFAYRQHRDALAYERKAKAVAQTAQKTRKKSSALQTQRKDKDASMANDEDADLDADWELDDQPDAVGSTIQADQNDLDYAALELAESRIPNSPIPARNLAKNPRSKPKTRNSALSKSAVRKPLSSLRPSGLVKKARRPRDVENSMTLDDMARYERRAVALMRRPDQIFHRETGTFGTVALVTEDDVPETRRLRPRPVAETTTEPVPELLPPHEPDLGEGRLIAEFSIVDDDLSGEDQDNHNGVCGLQDVLRHSKSVSDVALLSQSDTKTDQFFDEIDRVWYWEMQQLEQVEVNPIKFGSFINHTLNKGHTRVTHQALLSIQSAVPNAMADTVSAPTAIVKLKLPGLASLGLPAGESGVLGIGPGRSAEYSKITGRPKRKYTSRKRKHQDVDEDARDSDPEFVPGVERDTPPPPSRTRAAALKGKKSDIGLAPQRDRKSSKEFKDGNRLVIAFALVAAVCGGINQDHPNWGIIAHALSYRYDGEFLRRRWVHLRRFRKGDADRFRDLLHEPFLEAYEKGELPEIDFQNLTDTDWPTLFEWAELTLAPLQTAPKDRAPEAPILLESREATDQNFTIEEPARIFELSQDDYFVTNTDMGRRHLALRYNYGTPLPVDTKSSETNKDDTMLLTSWARAVALTKQGNYNSDAAGKKIKQVANGKVLTQVTNTMIDSHFLVQEKKGRHLPGRNFHIHDDVLRQFRRWPVKLGQWQEFQYLRMVAHAWYNINGHFRNNDRVDLMPAASDPEYLVLENMTAQGLIEMTMDLPAVKWDFDAPGPKLSPWGYGGANYETKRVQVQNLRFPITYRRTERYAFDHGLKKGVPIPLQPALVSGESGVRSPFWVDIHGNLVDDVWDMVLRSVLHLIVFRPGITATAIQRAHGDKLWAWEVDLMLQWVEDVGIAERWGAGEERDGAWKGGVRASGWWYCAFLPEIATWKAPGNGDFGLG